MQIRLLPLWVVVLLGLGTAAVTHAQIAPHPVALTMTRPTTMAWLFSQQGVCGRPREPGEIAVLGSTTPAVDEGTVRIPELNLASEIVAGCFEFRNLTLPRDPMLISFEIEVEGYRPTTWANWLVLTVGVAPILTPTLEPGNEPEIFDYCPDLLARPFDELSAAGYQQAQLCAQLPDNATLPGTGMGGPAVGSGVPVAPGPLALVGTALMVVGAAPLLLLGTRRQRA